LRLRVFPKVPVSGTLSKAHYEWDDAKTSADLRKNGVDFTDAIAASEENNRLEEIDARFV
jgi:uncharacterized DUF497 family protein